MSELLVLGFAAMFALGALVIAYGVVFVRADTTTSGTNWRLEGLVLIGAMACLLLGLAVIELVEIASTQQEILEFLKSVMAAG